MFRPHHLVLHSSYTYIFNQELIILFNQAAAWGEIITNRNPLLWPGINAIDSLPAFTYLSLFSATVREVAHVRRDTSRLVGSFVITDHNSVITENTKQIIYSCLPFKPSFSGFLSKTHAVAAVYWRNSFPHQMHAKMSALCLRRQLLGLQNTKTSAMSTIRRHLSAQRNSWPCWLS